MKLFLFLLTLAWAAPASAQSIISFAPARNAPAAPRNTAVAVTLSAPVGQGAVGGLKVFSTQAGGKKSGVTTVNGSTVSFAPTTPFKAGETVMATLARGAIGPQAQVWQFTAAATGGTGSFANSSNLAVPDGAGPLHLADVDSDGDLDLITFGIVAAAAGPSSVGLIQVHKNNGRGVFATASGVSVPEYFGGVAGYALSISVADVDADGDVDILASSTRPEVYVLTNDGTGAFTLASTIQTGAQSSLAIVTGDVDGDGDIDFVATNQGGSSHVFTSGCTVGENNGSGGFIVRSSGILSSDMVIRELKDINGDGALDAIAPVGAGLYAWLNDGYGTFGNMRQISASGNWEFFDFDGDGDLDLAVVASTSCSNTVCVWGVRILTNDGSGNFSYNGLSVPVPLRRLSAADVNGDGHPDLITTGYGLSGAPVDSIKVLLNTGNGGFGQPIAYAVPRNTGDVATGDVDGDGDIDVVASTYTTPAVAAGAATVLNSGTVLSSGMPTPTAVSLSIWPNPAPVAGLLHMAFSIPVTHATWRLATLLGQLVRAQSFTSNAATIPTAGLAAGMYLLTVQAEGQVPRTQRIVVE